MKDRQPREWWLSIYKSDNSGYVSGWNPKSEPPEMNDPKMEYVLVREVSHGPFAAKSVTLCRIEHPEIPETMWSQCDHINHNWSPYSVVVDAILLRNLL